jgi:hypothetical protein
MPEPEEILAQFRAGSLSAEAAAALLLPTLKATGELTLDIGEHEMVLLEALQRLASPPPERPPPLFWESSHWRALGQVADDLWHKLTERGLDRVPQCLNYVFLVGTQEAAVALEECIRARSDHVVTRVLPESFAESYGRIFGRTAPQLLTHGDLAAWVAWLSAIPPVPDASLDGLGVTAPPPGPHQGG